MIEMYTVMAGLCPLKIEPRFILVTAIVVKATSTVAFRPAGDVIIIWTVMKSRGLTICIPFFYGFSPWLHSGRIDGITIEIDKPERRHRSIARHQIFAKIGRAHV